MVVVLMMILSAALMSIRLMTILLMTDIVDVIHTDELGNLDHLKPLVNLFHSDAYPSVFSLLN